MLTVKELDENNIPLIADYWFNATPEYLLGMGVDITKLPTREKFTAMLLAQLALPYPEKKAYALIWELDGKPIGHSNVNPSFMETTPICTFTSGLPKPENRALGWIW